MINTVKTKPHPSTFVPRWPAGTFVDDATGAGGGRFMSRDAILRAKQKLKRNVAEAQDTSDETSSPLQEGGIDYAEKMRLAILERDVVYQASVARFTATREAALKIRDDLLGGPNSQYSRWAEIAGTPAEAEWHEATRIAGDAYSEMWEESHSFYDDVIEILRAPNPAVIPVEFESGYWDDGEWEMGDMGNAEFKSAWAELTSLFDESVITTGKLVRYETREGSGAEYLPDENLIVRGNESGEVTIWHEFGHWLEDNNDVYKKRVHEFLDERTKNQSVQNIPYGDESYLMGTYPSVPDDFVEPYMGREYVSSVGGKQERTATEVTSMGLDYLRRDPTGLAKGDPEYFNHLIMWMHGKYDTTVKAVQRDISHVWRDEGGRWTDTPGAGDDAPKEPVKPKLSDTERQRTLDSDKKPDIESYDFEQMVRASLETDHDFQDESTAEFFMDSWREADKEQKTRLYERYFEEYLGSLQPPNVESFIEEIGPEHTASEFTRKFDVSFEPLPELKGQQGSTPFGLFNDLPPDAPFDNKEDFEDATRRFWGISDNAGFAKDFDNPSSWSSLASRVTAPRYEGYRGQEGRPQEGDVYDWAEDPDTGEWEPSRWLTAEQASYLYNKPVGEHEKRIDGLRDKMGLTNNLKDVRGLMSEFGITEIFDPWEVADKDKAAYIDLQRQTRVRVSGLLERVDVSAYTKSEVRSAVGDYFDQAAEDAGLDSLLDAPEGSEAEMLGRIQWRLIDNPLQEEYNFRVRTALALGQIDPEVAQGLTYAADAQGVGGWQDLPDELYHTTTNVDAIIGDRLRSRSELGQQSGLGLGGGESDTISFTTDPDVGKQIERALHEAWYVSTGVLSSTEMLQIAAEGGGGADESYLREAAGYLTSPKQAENIPADFDFGNPEHIATLPMGIQEILDVDSGKASPPEREWGPKPEEYQREKAWDVFKAISSARERNGGFFDPLFFSSDWKGLAQADPEQFQTLKLKARPGAKGYLMGSMAEWRTVGGQTVAVEEAINHYDYKRTEDYERIVGKRSD